jgi:hypothetical protein
MSRRMARALLRLYPRRIRRRYGEELLDLQDELRAEGELSRGVLLRDLVVGAFLARSVRRRASVLVGALVLIAALAGGVAVTAAHRPAGRPSREATAAAPVHNGRALTVLHRSCYADPSSMTCTEQGCALQLRRAAVPARRHAATGPRSRRPRAACVPLSPVRRPRGLPITPRTAQLVALGFHLQPGRHPRPRL